MKLKKISWAIMLSLGIIPSVSAVEKTEVLEIIQVTETNQSPMKTVQQTELKNGPTSLGNALAKQMGIQSNHFGSGASTPVIRGQESYRNKIVQNGGDVVDMANMSPDHAIMVDPTLAKDIKIIQGVDTLLYASGITGAVVNVEDDKIPTQRPTRTVEGSLDAHYNANNQEQLYNLATNVKLSDHLVLHLEGLHRQAKNYKSAGYTERYTVENPCNNSDTPECIEAIFADDYEENIEESKNYRYINNSEAKSKQGAIGLSWIGEKGYLGIAYTDRRDRYGLTGHEHKAHFCHIHTHEENDEYLEGINLHCEHTSVNIDEDFHNHDPSQPEQYAKLRLHLKRVDLRGALNQPIKGIEQIRFMANDSRYEHKEIEGQYTMSSFRHNGQSLRMEMDHQPTAQWSGTVALQYSKDLIDSAGYEGILDKNTTHLYGLSGVERYQWQDLTFSLSGRIDHQKIQLADDKQLHRGKRMDPLRSMQYETTTYSFATGIDWQLTSEWKSGLTFSHQERAPSVQELYARGTHVATNSYEFGDEQYDRTINNLLIDTQVYDQFGIHERLKKEKSNNLDISLQFNNDQWQSYVGVYYKHFSNYIYAHTMDRFAHFRLLRYAQQPARFYGAEGNISYRFHPKYRLSLFGDYVRGKLDNGNVPRMPAARLGSRFNADLTNNLSASLEYTHTFSQHKTAHNELPVGGHNMLNAALSYVGDLGQRVNYRLTLDVNNILNQKVYASTSYLSHIPLMGRNVAMGASVLF
ncbi:TonB-dependent receptor [Lonepinella sp. BR2357]|uniref:TonB-dependent receptor n=1 Tax=Lonepinella sp. BR2357 TaxID=3434549 RepID=UPI003F6DE652